MYALLTASFSLTSRTNRAASARASSAALRHAAHTSHSISLSRSFKKKKRLKCQQGRAQGRAPGSPKRARGTSAW